MMNDWERQSSSYRRGYVAGQERDVYFAQLVEGAPHQEEAMRGYCDGLAAINEAGERERFEAWRRHYGDDDRDLRRDANNGEYAHSDRERLWQAWQAALTFGENHGDTSSNGREDNGTSRPG